MDHSQDPAFRERDASPVENRGGTIVPVAVIFTLLSTFMVGLRLYTRLVIVRSPGWEDWILLAASICSIVMAGLLVQQVSHGLGKHTYDLSAAAVSTISKYYWVETIFYTLALGLTKISIVFQYLRIFAATQLTRIACVCALCFLSMNLIQAFLLSIFTCTPVSNFWTSPELSGCINFRQLYVAQSSINIFSDLLVILLPIPVFQSLKLTRKERYALIGIFTLGSFGCVTTVVRLFYVVKYSNDTDVTWNNIDPMTWSALEVFVAITCASLPALRKAVRRMFPHFLQGSSYSWTTRPSGQAPDLPLADHTSATGRRRIALDTLDTLEGPSKDGNIVTVARSVSRDDDEAFGDRHDQHSEAQSLSESERKFFTKA